MHYWLCKNELKWPCLVTFLRLRIRQVLPTNPDHIDLFFWTLDSIPDFHWRLPQESFNNPLAGTYQNKGDQISRTRFRQLTGKYFRLVNEAPSLPTMLTKISYQTMVFSRMTENVSRLIWKPYFSLGVLLLDILVARRNS